MEGYNLKNRWLIIALDGMEYLLEEFNLKNIQQKVYGKTDVSNFPLLTTPILWGSFITGQTGEKASRKYAPKWDSPFLEWLRYFSIKLGLNRIKGKGKILNTLGYKQREKLSYEDIVRRFNESSVKTIFDKIPNSVALSVPPIQKWVSEETTRLMAETVSTHNFRLFEEHVMQKYSSKKETFIKIIRDGNWDLFMCHFMFTDLLGHFYINNPKKIQQIYTEADSLVKLAKEMVPEDVKVLVISDHGMAPPLGDIPFGDHTNYGFYSCNEDLFLKEPKISSFWDEIVC